MKGLRTTVISILAIGLLAGSAVGVAAQEEVADSGAAAYVQGFITGPGTCCGPEVETHDDEGNRLTLRGMVASNKVDMDDPRLDGDFGVTVNLDEYPQPGTDQRVEVHWGEVSITNDNGSWRGTWKSVYDPALLPAEKELLLYELTGAGAYEGLSALLAHTGGADEWPTPVGGAIYAGPLPPNSAYAAE